MKEQGLWMSQMEETGRRKEASEKEAISNPVEIKTGNIAKRRNLLNDRDMVLVLAVKHGWQYL